MLTIDLSAIAANYNTIRRKVRAGCAVASAVKADAYGLGMQQVAPVLYREGCRLFFVAHVAEGAALREMLPADAEIAVLNGLQAGNRDDFARHRLIPCLSSLHDIALWRDTSAPCILHFDTGMNRLGFDTAETARLLADRTLTAGLHIVLVMSHLVSAEETGNPLNTRQLALFRTVAQAFPGVKLSLANSSGVFLGSAYHFDVVRPGYGLYGGAGLSPVVRLGAPVLQIRRAEAGETAGYNATYRFDDAATLAVINLGYADGFLRSNSNRAVLYWQGQPCPVRGRVSMDLTIIDLGSIRGAHPQPGDAIEILGPHQDIDALAAACGTNGYEILTSLGRRGPRRYLQT